MEIADKGSGDTRVQHPLLDFGDRRRGFRQIDGDADGHLEPASASSMHCFAVAAASLSVVIVIDWTTTGAPPPTCTWPTRTPMVLWSFSVDIRLREPLSS